VPFPASTTAEATAAKAINGINISTGAVYGTTVAAGATQAQIAVGTISNQAYFCGGSVEIQ
jgi:hypothetical protein